MVKSDNLCRKYNISTKYVIVLCVMLEMFVLEVYRNYLYYKLNFIYTWLCYYKYITRENMPSKS